MAGEELKVTITAKDEASPVFDKVGKNASKSLGKVEDEATKSSTKAGHAAATGFSSSFSSKLGTLGSLGVDKFLAAGAVTAGVKFAIGAASDLQESLSKTDAVFRNNAGTVKEWAQGAADAFGQSEASALEASGTFGNLFQAFGVGLQPATDMSMTLTQLATDLASFNNTSVQDAIEALRSGLSGETEPLKRYGVALSDVRLKQEAFNMGLIATTKDAMSPAIKAQAAYSLIMKDTALAQGDFARTQDSYANSMRTLQANVTNAAAAMGEELLPKLASLAAFAAKGIDIAVKISSGDPNTGNDLLDDIITKGADILDSVNPFTMLQKGIDFDWGSILGGSEMDGAAKSAAILSDEMALVSRAYASAHGGAAGYSAAMQAAANANNQVGDSVSMAREGVRTYGQTLKEAEESLRGLIAAQLASVDSMFAVSDSYRQFQQANQDASEAVDDTKTAINEQQAATDAATQAAIANASATVAYAEEQAKLEGRTLSAKDSQKILIDTLYTLASQAAPAVQSQLAGVITKLQETGQQKPEPTVTLNDQASGPLGTVAEKITGLNGRSATAYVFADTSSANARLDALSRRLSALGSTGTLVNVPSGAVARFQEGGFVNAPVNRPVPAIVHGGEYVLSADMVDRIKRGDTSRGAAGSLSLPGSGGGGGVVVNFNGTFLASKAELGRMVDEAIAESRRRGNRAA